MDKKENDSDFNINLLFKIHNACSKNFHIRSIHLSVILPGLSNIFE